MKFFKSLVGITLVFSLSVFALSCSGSSDQQNDSSKQQGKEYTSAYVCPMHCEGSGSEEAGTCPVCGMDYVENEDHKSDGHKH